MMNSRVYGRCLALLAGAAMVGMSMQASAETKSYAVAWFTLASNAHDGDCPGGINPSDMSVEFRHDLELLGKTPAEIEDLFKSGLSESDVVLPHILTNRGRIDGKEVNAYSNPQAVADPKLHTIVDKFAYGFNLDGKGPSASTFEDPETHEPAVNNQAYRALGCLSTQRAAYPDRPSYWSWVWSTLRESMPAWIISVSADDLSKDGDVTISIDRALEHVMLDVKGETRADSTFRLDPSPQEHNSFKGKIQNGVVTITEPGDLHLLGDPFMFTELVFAKTHLRLKPKADGGMEGLIGGYQRWAPIYFMFSEGSFSAELNLGIDAPGVYHAMRKLADYDPDPVSGMNRKISAAYRIDLVPAYIAQPGAKEKTALAP